LDRAGAVFVLGDTNSKDLPVTGNAYQKEPHGGDRTIFNEFDPGDCEEGGGLDVFVGELNPTGSGLIYLTYLGGSGDEADFFQSFLGVDKLGHAFLASDSDSTDFPTTAGAFQSTNHGSFDETVTELNLDGSGLIYSTCIGGSDYDTTVNVRTIVVPPNGDAIVAGYTFSTDFPTVDPVQGSLAGVADLTLIELN
jgi:hypothetical protein